MNRWTAVWGAVVAAVPLTLWNAVSITSYVPFWRFALGLTLTVPGLLAGRWLPGPRPLAVCAAVGAVMAPVLTLDGWRLLSAALAWTGTIAVPWLVGRYRRQHHALVRAAEERAERSERERHQVAARVRAAERARIARDMHDSLGHDLTLLAVRIAALEVAADMPERHRAALGEVRAGAADATARLRDIIGLLRADADADAAPATDADLAADRDADPDAVPGPGGPGTHGPGAHGPGSDGPLFGGPGSEGPLFGGPGSGDPVPGATESGGPVPAGFGTAPSPTESVAELVRRTAASGVPVRVEHLDEPPPRALPTAYRVVQEALTNATKHAPGAPITLRLARVADGLVVEVTNPAPDRPPSAGPATAVPGKGVPATAVPGKAGPTKTVPRTAVGHGLVGLDERMRLAGGSLEAGSLPDGGFRLTARWEAP